jgi:hypothetical protein
MAETKAKVLYMGSALQLHPPVVVLALEIG